MLTVETRLKAICFIDKAWFVLARSRAFVNSCLTLFFPIWSKSIDRIMFLCQGPYRRSAECWPVCHCGVSQAWCTSIALYWTDAGRARKDLLKLLTGERQKFILSIMCLLEYGLITLGKLFASCCLPFHMNNWKCSMSDKDAFTCFIIFNPQWTILRIAFLAAKGTFNFLPLGLL